MDDATKADHDNLKGILPKQVRLYTSKALLGEYVFCTPGGSYWKYSNRGKLSQNKVTANDITNIDLACDKATGHSPTISIPIEGNTKYKVTVSEGEGGKYLRIDITKRTHRTVNYVFSGTADVDYPASVTPPMDTDTYIETSVVDLKQPAQTTVAGKKDGKDGTWTFNGWTLPEGVDFTDDNHTKFTMPDTNVTVTGTWTFTPTTSVYVYFQTVDTAGNPIGDNDHENVKGVKHNENGSGWATLGKLVTATAVTTETALGNEINDNNSNFSRHDSNSLDLSLIKSWGAPHKENGAADYVEHGTEAWHLDGKVKVYRAIYCDSDGTELKGFAPNTDPKYYLEGTTDIALTSEVPDVPGKVFDGWDTTSPDVTVADDNTFSMPGHDVTFTAKWKPGALKIEKILEGNPHATGKTFSFTVTPQGSTTSTDAQITGAGSETIHDLPVGSYTVTEVSSTAAVDGYRCTTQYSIDKVKWQEAPITPLTIP